MPGGTVELPEILENLISIDSVSGNEKEIGEWIRGFLEQNGFTVTPQRVKGESFNLFARKGNPSLLFFGHMDTVAPVEGWGREPLTLEIEGDKAYGLGSWDMKGGVAAILHNAQHAENMAVLFTVDEEGISRGGWRAIENREFFEGIKGIISAESGNTETTYGGARHITTGRNGRRAFRIEKNLSAGHAAVSQQEWIDWLHGRMHSLPQLKSRIVIRDLRVSSKELSAPDRIEMDINVLISPEEEGTDFEKLLAEHFQGSVSPIPRDTPYADPYNCAGDPFVEKVAAIAEREFGECGRYIANSVGDENILATLGIPVVIVGPEGRNEHAADEWVSVKSLNEISRLYEKVLKG